MQVYEVLEVTIPAEAPEPLIGAFIDTPVTGSTGDVYVLHVVGWVLARRSQPVTIEVLYRPEPDRAQRGPDRVIRTTPVRGDRSDVAAAFPDVSPDVDCHFESLVNVIGMTPEFELQLRAVLEDGSRADIGTIRVRHQPLRTGFQPRLAPLTLNCLGRTGTTWVMQLLAAHPQIVVYRRFPYESSPAKYWMQALKVMTEPSNMIESAHPDTFHDSRWWTGNNPYFDDGVMRDLDQRAWFARTHIEHLASFFQSTIDGWYQTVARSQGQDRPLYFAEKHMWPNYIPVLLRELYPQGKEVFLVRDFRDVALSILAFDEKRGYPGFGRREGMSDEQYIREVLKPAAQSVANGWRTRGDSSHLLRYEDLVARPEETLASLFAYLNLDSSPSLVADALAQSSSPSAELEGHRTSRDQKDSIGRWRRERDDSFRALCQEVFADELAEFGYLEAGVPT